MMNNYPLLSMVLCLDETSPDVKYYKELLHRFYSIGGCFLQIDGDPFNYAQLNIVLEEIDSIGIEGVGIRAIEPVSDADAVLTASHRIRSVMLRDRALEPDSIINSKKHGVQIECSELITADISVKLSELLTLCEKYDVRSIVLENSIIARYRGISVRELKPEQRFQLMKEIVRHNQSRSPVGISLSHCPNKVLLHPEMAKGGTLGGCSAGIISCAVDTDGSIIPCLPMKEQIAGSIVDNDLFEIWDNSPLFCQLRDRTGLRGACGSCAYRLSCGGCRAVGYYRSGDIMAPDTSCHLCLKDECADTQCPSDFDLTSGCDK